MNDVFANALDELDFARAKDLIDSADTPMRSGMVDRLARAETAARSEARSLASEIQRLARENDFEALLAIKQNPRTAALIQLLPTELVRGSEVQLDGAQKWLDQRIAASRRHLRRAREAVAGYDTARGKAELHKVDRTHLSEAERAEVDDLREQLTAAEIERMELEMRTSDVLAEHSEIVRAGRRRSFLVWGLAVTVVVVVLLLVGR